MNMFKKTGGFTLVELIVVIAILAILAGVAIPAYSGYIKSANETSDNQAVEAIETAMTAALAMNGKDWSSVATYFTVSVANEALKVVSKADANSDLDEKIWSDFCTFAGVETTATEYSAGLKAYANLTEVEAGANIDFTPGA